jgi:uncharacterized protein (TIGR00255 family)
MSLKGYMLKSMTAYGRASISNELGTFLVEIQSLNRRYLEVTVALPKLLSYLETEVRKKISTHIHRGIITVKIAAQFAGSPPVSVFPNISLAKQIQTAWEKIAQSLPLQSKDSFRLEMLLNEPDILIYQENFTNENLYREIVFQAIDKALDNAIHMKKTEGDYILADIASRLELIENWIQYIKDRSPESIDKYKKKLTEKIEEVLHGSIENEERILREVCLYADKVDITEELIRFTSHCRQFVKHLKGSEEGVGKTLEFLLQEMQREANTINSKAAEIEISQRVVNIKGELEKIRELIQNVE